MKMPSKQFLIETSKYLMTWRLSLLLTLCIILGGTAQDVITYKIPLYLVSLLFIGQALSSKQCRPLSNLLRPSIILAGLFLLLFILQLIPLPPSIWSSISGREIVTEGYALIGEELPWLPISLTPEKTFFSLFGFIPIMAVIIVVQLSATKKEIEYSISAVIFITILSLLLGMLQSLGGLRNLTLYEYFNEGFPVGFFANLNHQACLIAIVMPLAILMAFGRKSPRHFRNGINPSKFLAMSSVIIISIGAIFLGSGAGYLLLVLGVILSIFILSRGKRHSKTIIAIGLIAIGGILIDGFFLSGQIQALVSKFTVDSQTSRLTINKTTLTVIKDYWLFGAGAGSFSDIYNLYEDRSTIGQTYVNEAHNDYLQIIVEFGVLGFLIIVAGIVCFLSITLKALSGTRPINTQLLFYCLAVLMPVLHALVDYPLRTISIAAVSMYLLLLIDRATQELS